MPYVPKPAPSLEPNSGESMVVTTGLRLSQEDRLRNLIRMELFRQALGKEEAETFEEADDFDFDDGDEWRSDYENEFDPPVVSVEHSEAPPSVTNPTPGETAVTPPPAGENVSGQ